jgi:putative RNA 2'-phosphotransferase
MPELDYTRLSKAISHALRHAPGQYGLELDDEGWTSTDALLVALRQRRPEWHQLSKADLETMVARQGKKRFELRYGRIRALYGHSIERKIEKKPAEPPPLLYHGTAAETAELVCQQGLKPMGRQYVHLSAEVKTAYEVGQRKTNEPVILQVDAALAHAAGIRFYRGNETIWLADHIPPVYIRSPDRRAPPTYLEEKR